MKSWSVRILSLVLCLVLFSLNIGFAESVFPLTEEPKTFTVMTIRDSVHGPYDEMITWTTYEEMTNVHIDWIEVTSDALTQQVHLTLAGDTMPDMYYKCAISESDLLLYGADGALIALNDLIDKYAPNVKAVFEADPTVKQTITMSDGNIYSLPYIMNCDSPRLQNKLFLNLDWMEKAGASVPTTTDELFDTLMKMRAYDYDGDGQLNERIIISREGIRNLIAAFAGSFGLANRSYNTLGFWDEDPENEGKLRFWPTTERYKELLQYLNKLYANNLIDQEIFTQVISSFTGKAVQGPGMLVFVNNAPTGSYAEYYEGLTTLVGPHGDQTHASVNSKCTWIGAFAISANCKDPELAIKWVDYFYSPEGSLLHFMGVDGETCYYNEDLGKWQYVDAIANNTEGLTYDQSVGRYVCWGSNGGPAVATYEVFSGPALNAISQAAADKIVNYAVDGWPSLKYTLEENEVVVELSTSITSYIDQMTAEFIIGRVSFDEWDAYVSTIEEMGLAEWGKLAQAALDRMLSAK